jgi:hypothetical protein
MGSLSLGRLRSPSQSARTDRAGCGTSWRGRRHSCWLVLRILPGCMAKRLLLRRARPSTAVRAGYRQRRPPSRASSVDDGSSRAIAAAILKAGTRWPVSLAVSGSRGGSARGRRARHAPCRVAVITEGGGGTARAGSRDFSLRSHERGGLAPPDNGAPLSEVARFGPRARARTPLWRSAFAKRSSSLRRALWT